MAFDRYKYTRINKITYSPPLINITERDTDKYENYVIGISRLDKIAYKYYNDPTLGEIILMGNPEYLSEADIPDNVVIRIPFPLNQVITEIDTLTLIEISK
jgi:hypothetical protein